MPELEVRQWPRTQGQTNLAMGAGAWGGHATTLGRSEAVQAMTGRKFREKPAKAEEQAGLFKAARGTLLRKGLVKAPCGGRLGFSEGLFDFFFRFS